METSENPQNPVLALPRGAVDHNLMEMPENPRHPVLAAPGGAVDGDNDQAPLNFFVQLITAAKHSNVKEKALRALVLDITQFCHDTEVDSTKLFL